MFGTPSREPLYTDEGLQGVRQAYWDEVTEVMGIRKKTLTDREDRFYEMVEGLKETFGELQREEVADASVMTLAPARLSLPAGSGAFDIPVARVPLEAIAAWWVGPTATYIPPESSGGDGGFFVGGLFPVGS